MEEDRIIKAHYWFKDDTTNNHRLFLKAVNNEIKGIIYIPKNQEVPDQIILKRID